MTTSKTLGEKVQEEIEGYLKKLSRAEIIEKSLENFGYILEAETLNEALEVVNAIASEHLEIVTANPFEVMTKVRNAGAIFSESTVLNHLEIILQDQTMYFQQTELRSSSPH